MKTIFVFFVLLFMLPLGVSAMSSGIAVLNEHGNLFAISRAGRINVYELPRLNLLRSIDLTADEDPYDDSFNEQVVELVFARDSRSLWWFQQGYFYSVDLTKSGAKPEKFNSKPFDLQSWFTFSVDANTSKICTSEMGKRNLSDQPSPCSPTYRAPVLMDKSGKVHYGISPKACAFVSMVEMDKQGNAVFDMQGDGIYYYKASSGETKKIFNGSYRLFRNCISADGKTILMNTRLPLTNEQKAIRDEKIEGVLKSKFNNIVRNAAEAERYQVDWAQYTKEKEWLYFCYGNDSVYTLVTTTLEDGVWQKPVQPIPPHLNPIAWGVTLSDDGNRICWMDLQRGEDGNSITQSVLRLTSRVNGVWQAPRDVFAMKGYDNTGGRTSYMICGDYMVSYLLGRCRIISGLNAEKFQVREVY